MVDFIPEMIGAGALAGMLGGAMVGMIVVMILVGIGIYVYTAFAMMTIAKKLKYKYPWFAWIPIVQFVLLPMLAKKEWYWVFMFLVPFANFIFMIIWTWKIFERRKYPGWLALVPILFFMPVFSFLAWIAQMIILGFVAWKDQ